RLVPFEGLERGAQIQTGLDVSGNLLPSCLGATTRKAKAVGKPLASREISPGMRVGTSDGPRPMSALTDQMNTASARHDRLEHAGKAEGGARENRALASVERRIESLE